MRYSEPTNARRVSRGILLIAAGLLVLEPHSTPAVSTAASTAVASTATRHKVQVAPALRAQMAARGARLIGDYGSYLLYETDAEDPVLASNGTAQVRDDYNFVLLNAGRVDTSKATATVQKTAVATATGKRLRLVQFAGPIRPEWREEVLASGVQIIAYVPQNAYLVYGEAKGVAALQSASVASQIQWQGTYDESYKIHPRARTVDKNGNPREIGTDQFAVQLASDAEANPATLQLLEELKLEDFQRQEECLDYINIVVRLSATNLTQIAAQPDVVSIQPYFPRKLNCERQAQIVAGQLSGTAPAGPGYLAWLLEKGFTQEQFTASGFTVDLADSGLDNGTASPYHFGLYVDGSLGGASRVSYVRLVGRANHGSTLKGCDGHGTLNAHIVGGYDNGTSFPFVDSSGYHYGLGICPFVKVGSSVIFDPSEFTNPSYNSLVAQAYQSGARISNNSWGGTADGTYDIDSQTYDALVRDAQRSGVYTVSGNQEMVIVFAGSNEGPDPMTIGSPGTAKNVITVGAAENVQAYGGADGSGVTDSDANSANDVASFSGQGPCTDGRHKPEIVAPGTHVSGGVAQAATQASTGTSDSCYTGEGVSGGIGGTRFYPSNQQFYTASSGTSHSTPCVSGACALVRQYFINQTTNPPSPAMTKAYLLNSARYLTGAKANDSLWSDAQGMGELDLGTSFDGTPRILRDQVADDLFTASGQTRTFTGTIAASDKPFRVTLAWTDAPGSTVGAAYNNDLDLTVTVGGKTYKGNVFSGAYSTTGGGADAKDNCESVFLPAGGSGAFEVTVTGTSINSIGVPNSANALQQDFALVIYNAEEPGGAGMTSAGVTIETEGFEPANGAADPGEAVTAGFALKNIGSADTANLVATLVATTNVVPFGDPQSYGVVVAGGTAVSRTFGFTALGDCGDTVTATLQLQDGATTLGVVNFEITLGAPTSVTNFTQNFDSVTVPGLPSGWSTASSGSGEDWTTSTYTYDTSPTIASVSTPDSPGTSELVSPVISITGAAPQVRFSNSYELEVDSSDSTLAYDGGVLEIQIGDGDFTDILTAGGAFAAGGYNCTIDSTDDNPLVGRRVWSGNSGGFVSTIVNLPTSTVGQSIRLKWRLGLDTGNFYGGSGWSIDSLSVSSTAYTCSTAATEQTVLYPVLDGQKVLLSFATSTGKTYTVQAAGSLVTPAWTAVWSVAGNGATQTYTNAPDGEQRFFRLQIQ